MVVTESFRAFRILCILSKLSTQYAREHFPRLATRIHCPLVNTRCTTRRAALWLVRCAHVALPAGAAMQWHVYTYWRLHHGIMRRGSHNRGLSLLRKRDNSKLLTIPLHHSLQSSLVSKHIFSQKESIALSNKNCTLRWISLFLEI